MKRLLIAVAMMIGFAGVPVGVVGAATDFDGSICDKITDEELKDAAGCNDEGDIKESVRNGINAAIYILGIAAVGVIVFGGVRYTISQGDPGKIKNAKNTILYAVIGLIVAIMSYAIVNFVLEWTMGSPESSEEAEDTGDEDVEEDDGGAEDEDDEYDDEYEGDGARLEGGEERTVG